MIKRILQYRKQVFWFLIVALILNVVIIEDMEDTEPYFSISTFIYIVTLFAISIPWLFKQIISTFKLKTEQNKTELMHLQSQVNPHFFFNMLNNLYGLVEKDNKKAQELILKLSDMMRYSIYEGQKNRVPLEDEVAYLENYIELHKMRYHKDIEVNFNIHIQEEGYQIMPLLFIILLENAFKHGVENLRENAYVNISMMTAKKEIHFGIENNFDEDETEKEAGIGLKNIKRRLELVYPKKHSLTFSKTEDVYKAQMSIQL